MAAQIVPKQLGLGFDPLPDLNGKMVFQMVPRGGARGMLLLEAPKHTLELVPTLVGKAGTGKFDEVAGLNSPKREFWVAGFTEGLITIVAKNPATGLADLWLQCHVAELKKVRVGFYVVTDASGRKSKQFNASMAKSMLDGAAEILHLQANVKLELAFIKEPWPDANIPDLGKTPQVNLAIPMLEKLMTLVEADFHVFLIWDMEDSAIGLHGLSPLGATRGVTCLIRDTKGPEIVLAHEICHGFGLMTHNEHDRSNLMFKVAAGGKKLNKAQILRFNQFASVP